MDDKLNKLGKIPVKGLEPLPAKTIKEFIKEKTMPEVKETTKPDIEIGIEETLDALDFTIALANGVIATLKDGKVSVADIPNFIKPLIKLPAAISGIDKVPAELNQLRENELQIILDEVKKELSTDDIKTKAIVEQSLKILFGINELIEIIKSQNAEDN
ncbi:MAG: hypothetical protein HYS25_13795 [Ignavibacteriales bacterium]|nr:hypothetical protein [Ignavibacteriales bacterium]